MKKHAALRVKKGNELSVNQHQKRSPGYIVEKKVKLQNSRQCAASREEKYIFVFFGICSFWNETQEMRGSCVAGVESEGWMEGDHVPKEGFPYLHFFKLNCKHL